MVAYGSLFYATFVPTLPYASRRKAANAGQVNVRRTRIGVQKGKKWKK